MAPQRDVDCRGEFAWKLWAYSVFSLGPRLFYDAAERSFAVLCSTMFSSRPVLGCHTGAHKLVVLCLYTLQRARVFHGMANPRCQYRAIPIAVEWTPHCESSVTKVFVITRVKVQTEDTDATEDKRRKIAESVARYIPD